MQINEAPSWRDEHAPNPSDKETVIVMESLPSKEDFLSSVAQHQMRIERDDGKFRHIVFARPASGVYRFSLTTWPGHLCITGDVGTYVFSRLPDMFDFFREPEAAVDHGKLKINLEYWAQKCLATDVCNRDKGGYETFDPDLFRQNVREWAQEHAESDPDIDAKSLLSEVASVVLARADDGETAAYEAALNFEFNGRQIFGDFWEVRSRSYSYDYIWSCYAIVWGIALYDAHKLRESSNSAN